MNLKKITSALVCLALMIGLVPAGTAFAEADSFTNAWGDVIRKEDCLYYEDFENYTGSDFNISSDITDKGYWHNEVTGDGKGNRYMRYYATPKSAAFDADDAKNLIANKEILPATEEINNKGWYEIGYTYYVGDMRAYMTNIFGVYMDKSIVSRLASHNWSYPQWLRHWTGANYPDGFFERNGWSIKDPIAIKVILDASTGDIVQYYKYGSTAGDVKSYGNNTSNPGYNTKIKIGSKANINLRISCDEDPVKTSERIGYAAAEEPSFMIDNLYVKKLPTYELSFDKNDGTGIIKTQVVSPVSEPQLPAPERDGWQFAGWYLEPECENVFDKDRVSGDKVTIYAKWLKIHTISFVTDCDTQIAPIQTVESKITMPEAPKKIGYEFSGWYSDSTFETPFDGSGISGDMTIHVKWILAHKITFETNGGEPVEPIYTVKGVESVPDAVRVGYRFDGWFTDEDLTQPFDCTDVSEDITVYAKWTRKHVITFETNGGEPIEPYYTLEDIEELPKAVKPGFGFEGWYTDRELTKVFDAESISEDITLYAKYSNIIFHEDFENDTENAWLKTACPNGWESLAAQGYGVVKDRKGNYEYHCAEEPGNYIDINFPNGGPGLYEIEFNARSDGKSWYLANLFSPLNGNTIVAPSHYGNGSEWIVMGQNGYMFLYKLTGTSDVDGYINIKFRVDTENKVTYAAGEYTNIIKKVFKAETSRLPFTAKGDVNGLTGIRLRMNHMSKELYKTTFYMDDIYVRKIDRPVLTASTPSEDKKDTELRPTIRLEFNQRIDSAYITTDNFNIKDENGTAIAADEYTIAEEEENGKSVIYLNLKKDLEYMTTYYINISDKVRDKSGYYLDKNYSIPFTTKPLKYEVAPKLTDRDGAIVSDISVMKGKALHASVHVRNFAGEANEKIFAAAALVDASNGRQLGYAFEEFTLGKGEEKDAVDARFEVPESAGNDLKVYYYVWNSRTERKALTDKYILPQ